ncbi:nuclear transport factor 2 family protein [Nonomuraea endophytica]|uniref:nuclear transport factor 2 family protein n=1 Tax=Nonomuraea endophytica TaxID=714136 RepID=UPI0037C7BE7E
MTSDDLLHRLRVLEDREAIRDVLYRYARGADRCDLELFKSCYWPDAVDCHWFFNGNAHAFADYVISLLAELRTSQHSITNPMIELDGDRAFAECQWYVLHRMELGDGSGRFLDQQLEGRYVDVFERRDGEWRILRRQTVTEAGREFVVEDLNPGIPDDLPIAGRRAPRDLVYAGMDILDLEVIKIDGMDLWTMARARHR